MRRMLQRAYSGEGAGVSRTAPRPTVGVGAVVWRGPQVLLIRRAKPPRAGEWSLPGGKQEWGETVVAAVRREVRQETALELGPLTFVDIVDLVATDAAGGVVHHYTLLDFTAEAKAGVARAGDDAAAVAWFERDELVSLNLWEPTFKVITRAAALRPDGGHSPARS